MEQLVITEKDMFKRYTYRMNFFIHYYPDEVNDENYCQIRFFTRKTELWVDGKSSVLSF